MKRVDPGNGLVAIFAAAIALAGVAPAACAQQEGDGAGPRSSRDVERLRGTDEWRTDFANASVPLSEIVSGGPPKDGIPPIDEPKFESAEEAAEWLEPRDPLMVVSLGDEVKAYPLGILIWHEIVNDVVGGVPVAVTFCPLCNTALVFDRRLDGRTLDFGTTGRLRQSDLVMYDRQTESWWQQAVGEAIVGELTGRKLELVPANTLGWERVRRLYPNVRVLSRDTGFPSYASSGRYGQNPYRGYDTGSGPYPRFVQGEFRDDLPAMERVVAIDRSAGWAVPFSLLARGGDGQAVNADVDGGPVVVFWAPGAASALDEGRIASGRDVGQTAVFDRRVGDRVLTFAGAGDDGGGDGGGEGDAGFVDAETGSVWDLSGTAVSGPLSGKRLEAVAHGNHFWFAWTAFRPESEVWAGGGS